VGEYVARSHGDDYEMILAHGGGIMATVRATRSADEARLAALARSRAAAFLRGGVTALEIKSGYGLDTETELRMLRVARDLAVTGPQRVTTTLLAHVSDPELDRTVYLERFVSETVPEVAHLGLADAIDVFCDRGAFTLAEARRILEAGASVGLKLKLHAEQLSHTGAALLLAELGGLSADHLEVATTADFEALAAAGSVATLLPGAAAILKKRLPDAALLRQTGVTVALASDHNPGSSPLYGLLPALQLATALAGFTVEETVVAGTASAADAVGRPTWGRLEPGSVADYLVVDGPDALLPLYSWGDPQLHEVVIGGTSVLRTLR
jgi:imidazolonepropionase